MKVRDIAAAIEEAAPLWVQESFDNAGLVVGNPEADIRRVLLCVDITPAVVEEAIAKEAGMIVAHHPAIFHPLRHITGTSYNERVVEAAIRHDIALYAAHTNLDNVRGGLSFHLAGLLGLREIDFLAPSAEKAGTGTGVVGRLEGPTHYREFLATVKEKLRLEVVRHSAPQGENVLRVAICSGSGASFTAAARAAGADIYLAADFRYNDFLGADGGMMIADIGHFESEYCAKAILFDIIRKKLPTFVILHSEQEQNPVNYLR
ncbi:hypothetical protein FACS1894159_11280 [Bacteroidia bacterium]|nr:hypothetical protein FACS1894159_11280 [Bacteroidia bacterium]